MLYKWQIHKDNLMDALKSHQLKKKILMWFCICVPCYRKMKQDL